MIAICLGPALLRDSSDSPLDFSRDTILHRSKYLAVSAGLNRVVSVRNSISLWEGITLYFFSARPAKRGKRDLCSDFPLRPYVGVAIRCLPQHYSIFLVALQWTIARHDSAESTCNFLTSMLYSPCECETKVILTECILTFIVNNVCAAKNALRGVLCFFVSYDAGCCCVIQWIAPPP